MLKKTCCKCESPDARLVAEMIGWGNGFKGFGPAEYYCKVCRANYLTNGHWKYFDKKRPVKHV
jgi:hypothetical protein